VTDFKQLYEGLETLEEDHQEQDHPEEQDQSPPPLPKAPYRQLPPET